MAQPRQKTSIRKPLRRDTHQAALTEIRAGGGKKTPRGGEKTPAIGVEPRGSEQRISEGGKQLGRDVAFRRLQLGLSQADLAARTDMSEALVARIEEGQPPSTVQLRRLADVLSMEPEPGVLQRLSALAVAGGNVAQRRLEAVRSMEPEPGVLQRLRARAVAGGAVAGGAVARKRWEPLGRRWLLVGLAAAALVSLLVVLGSQSSGTDAGDPSSQLAPVVIAAPAVPIAVREAKQSAREAKAAERRAAAAAAARKRKAAAAAEQSDSYVPVEPASGPVASPPPAPSGGGSKSPASPPEIQHGIGSGGG